MPDLRMEQHVVARQRAASAGDISAGRLFSRDRVCLVEDTAAIVGQTESMVSFCRMRSMLRFCRRRRLAVARLPAACPLASMAPPHDVVIAVDGHGQGIVASFPIAARARA